MTLKTQRYTIRIPNNITIIHCEKKNILLIRGPLARRVIFLNLKIFVNTKKKFITISSDSFRPVSNKKQKRIKSMQGTTFALIKHKLTESSTIINKKLKLHGVGYRVTLNEMFADQNLLTFKLGYSHLIYYKIPKNLDVFCFNRTKFSIFGNYYQDISQISAQIRSKKKPEPYKGKGILYDNEIITLKEGKKV